MQRKILMMTVVFGMAVIGAVVLRPSQATTHYILSDPVRGTIVSPAESVSDVSAIEAQAVNFGANPTLPPNPPASWQSAIKYFLCV